MNILEVREGFITFVPDKNIYLSDFIKVQSNNKTYIAQVIQFKFISERRIALAKLLFIENSLTSKLEAYDKSQPLKNSEIFKFTSEILQNSVNYELPVVVGKSFCNTDIVFDASAFNNKMLVSIDNIEQTNEILKNFVNQFNFINKKVIIIDTVGNIKANKKIAGIDFKLPLNTDTLDFLYEECLNDATSESKSMISDVFADLKEYSKTTNFVPFNILKSIVLDFVDKSHIFKLLVLKNKLVKFDKLGYFANNKQEYDNILKLIEENCVVFDLSKLDVIFQNKFISYIYSLLKGKENIQVFLQLSNSIKKEILRNVMLDQDVSTTFVTHSNFKFLNNIKHKFDNFILTPSIKNNQIFSVFKSFLNTMPKNSFFVAGECINYIQILASFNSLSTITKIENKKQNNIEELATEELLENNNGDDDKENKSNEINDKEYFSSDNNENFETQDIVKINNLSNGEQPELELKNNEDVTNNNTQPINVDIVNNKLSELENNYISKSSQQDIKNIFGDASNYEDIESDEIELIKKEEAVVTRKINELDLELEFDNDLTELKNLENNVSSLVEQEQGFDNNVINAEIYDFNEQNLCIEQDNELSEINHSDDDNFTTNEYETLEENLDFQQDNELSEINNSDDDNFATNKYETLEENLDFQQDNELSEINNSDDELDLYDDIVELDPSFAEENDILIDIEENENNLDDLIAQDVDKMFSSRKEDDYTEEDLDFIEELNNSQNNYESIEDLEEISVEKNLDTEDTTNIQDYQAERQENNPEDEILVSNEVLETKQGNVPIIPVYEAEVAQEDIVTSDNVEQGDRIIHAKLGVGVIEKIINYGNKKLYYIKFENLGRKLLDPTLVEIKKY